MFQKDYDEHSDEVLRVAFDGDGVLFSDESEKVTKEKGLESFFQNEIENEDTPLTLVRLLVWNHLLVQLILKWLSWLVLFDIHKAHITQLWF